MTPESLLALCREHGIAVSIAGLIREHDAAKLCDVSTRTLRDWRRDGIGPPSVRLGGSWRYPVDGLAAALTPAEESGEIRKNAEVLDGDAPTNEPHPAMVQSQVA